MRRISLVVGALIAVAVFTGGISAQAPPNFSGKWTLVPNPVSPTYPPGGTLTIAQDMTTLTVDATAYHVKASTNGTWSETPYPTRSIYILDGAEHPRQVVADPPPASVRPASISVMSSTLEEALSKATWAGRQLVIMTYEKMRMTAPSQTPSISLHRRTLREALSLETDGTLVWETLIVTDPLPWGREVTTPVPFRRVYKKG